MRSVSAAVPSATPRRRRAGDETSGDATGGAQRSCDSHRAPPSSSVHSYAAAAQGQGQGETTLAAVKRRLRPSLTCPPLAGIERRCIHQVSSLEILHFRKNSIFPKKNKKKRFFEKIGKIWKNSKNRVLFGLNCFFLCFGHYKTTSKWLL